MKKKLIDSIMISVLATLLTAGIAMLFVDTKSDWYLSLNQPSFQPRGWVFGVVWGILYILYGVTLTLAQINTASSKVYGLFLLQSVLNISWCLFYFTLHLLYSGLAIIIAYLVVTYLTARKLYDYSKIGAYLFIPQGIWLIIALILNYSTILLN
ncbi:MAG: tryptophan-rich sensory protein [Clostridiales bacterium]|nr:tryptophan-rich sensory protein [Clostridiales bacterium]